MNMQRFYLAIAMIISGALGSCNLWTTTRPTTRPATDEETLEVAPEPAPTPEEVLQPAPPPPPEVDFPNEPISHPYPDSAILNGPCVAACVGIGPFTNSTDATIAKCYSCQCKAAMDGWLPTQQELQCGLAQEVPVLVRNSDGDLVEAERTPTSCATPSSFQLDCTPGSRHGRIANGDSEVRWLCRQSTEGDSAYDLVGVIAHNTRSGATCFWDATPQHIQADNFPELGIADAEEAVVNNHVDSMSTLGGEGCIGCHESDPFIYTPFLSGVDAPTGSWTKGPYHLVGLSNGPVPMDSLQISAPEAQPCLECHRLGASFSTFLTHEASGRLPVGHLQPQSYPYDRWMPHSLGNALSEEDWQYGAAVDYLLECDTECDFSIVPKTPDDISE